MTENVDTTPVATEQKTDSKELNFRKQQNMYENQLHHLQSQLDEAQRQLQARQQLQQNDDDDEEEEQYVDRKKLKKTLSKFEQQTKQVTQNEIQRAINEALEKKEQTDYLNQNPDFYDVLNNNAEELAKKAPTLANSILRMPNNFERQKLVYENIKALGLGKTEKKNIQDKIDNRNTGAYYQPSGVGNAGFSTGGDFSTQGQKEAYDRVQNLKRNLRLK